MTPHPPHIIYPAPHTPLITNPFALCHASIRLCYNLTGKCLGAISINVLVIPTPTSAVARRAECPRHALSVHAAPRHCHCKSAVRDSPILTDHVPDRDVVPGQVERNSLGRPRLQVDPDGQPSPQINRSVHLVKSLNTFGGSPALGG